MKDKQKRMIRACLALTAVLLFSLLSLLFIGNETQHDCDGDHCEICETLEVCAAVLKSSTGIALTVTGLVLLLPFMGSIRTAYSFEWPDETLVAQKIHIND